MLSKPEPEPDPTINITKKIKDIYKNISNSTHLPDCKTEKHALFSCIKDLSKQNKSLYSCNELIRNYKNCYLPRRF